MTRQELRRARKLTQVSLAKALGITQDGVSRLEKRTDLLLSTLREYVEAMGGRLSLIAEFHDREPVLLSGIAEEEEPRTATQETEPHGQGRPLGFGLLRAVRIFDGNQLFSSAAIGRVAAATPAVIRERSASRGHPPAQTRIAR